VLNGTFKTLSLSFFFPCLRYFQVFFSSFHPLPLASLEPFSRGPISRSPRTLSRRSRPRFSRRHWYPLVPPPDLLQTRRGLAAYRSSTTALIIPPPPATPIPLRGLSSRQATCTASPSRFSFPGNGGCSVPLTSLTFSYRSGFRSMAFPRLLPVFPYFFVVASPLPGPSAAEIVDSYDRRPCPFFLGFSSVLV